MRGVGGFPLLASPPRWEAARVGACRSAGESARRCGRARQGLTGGGWRRGRLSGLGVAAVGWMGGAAPFIGMGGGIGGDFRDGDKGRAFPRLLAGMHFARVNPADKA